MFFGEFLCLVTFKIIYTVLKRRQDGSDQENGLVKGNRDFSSFILLTPALCDMTATTTSYAGLSMTTASSFQMLRGMKIFFLDFWCNGGTSVEFYSDAIFRTKSINLIP